MEKSHLGPLLSATLALFLYANTLGYDFSYDDIGVIVDNRDIQQFNWSGMLVDSYWRGAGDGLYRPITILSYGVNQLIAEEASCYHAVNVVLHAVNVLLLYFFVARFCGRERAFWTAMCFAANPLLSEAVASVVGRAELLSFFFGVLGWITWDYGKEKNRTVWLLIAGCVFLLSQLAKETGIVFAAAAVVADWKKEKTFAYTNFIPIAAGCSGLLLKLWAIGSLRPRVIGFIDNPLAYAHDAERVANGLLIYIRYLVKAIYPWPLSVDYSFDQISLVKPWYAGEVLLVVCVLGSALLILLRWIGSNRFTLRWSVAVGLSIFTVSSIPTASSTIFAERLLYTPLAGFALFLSGLILRMSAVQGRILLVGIIAVYALLTLERIPVWKNDTALFKSAVETSSNSARSYYGLGLSMHRAGQVAPALEAYESALKIYPKYADAQYNRAALLLGQGKLEEAYKAYRDVAEWNPGYVKARRALALLEVELGANEKGIQRLYELVAEGGGEEAYESLVRVLLQLDRRVEAERVLVDGLKTIPQSARLRELRVTVGVVP